MGFFDWNDNSVFYKGIYGKKWYLSTWFICLCLFSWFLIIPGIVALILLIIQSEENKKIVNDLSRARTTTILLNKIKDLENNKNDLIKEIDELEKERLALHQQLEEERKNFDEQLKKQKDVSEDFVKPAVKDEPIKNSINDDNKLGYKKCNFCDENDTPSTKTYVDPWDTYKHEKPVKTFSITNPDDCASSSDYDIGDEVLEDYDYDKDKQLVDINCETFTMPKSARDFLEGYTNTYRMFILDVTETDTFKIKLKIGIFEEI